MKDQKVRGKMEIRHDLYLGDCEAYAKRINKFTLEFGNLFCDADGAIDWERLVRFNSSS